jgi:hypothetical protein
VDRNRTLGSHPIVLYSLANNLVVPRLGIYAFPDDEQIVRIDRVLECQQPGIVAPPERVLPVLQQDVRLCVPSRASSERSRRAGGGGADLIVVLPSRRWGRELANRRELLVRGLLERSDITGGGQLDDHVRDGVPP